MPYSGGVCIDYCLIGMGQHLRLHCHTIGCSSVRTGISRNGPGAFTHNERNAYTPLVTLRMIRVLLNTLQYLPMSDRTEQMAPDRKRTASYLKQVIL
jgi:hypothetical protein